MRELSGAVVCWAAVGCPCSPPTLGSFPVDTSDLAVASSGPTRVPLAAPLAFFLSSLSPSARRTRSSGGALAGALADGAGLTALSLWHGLSAPSCPLLSLRHLKGAYTSLHCRHRVDATGTPCARTSCSPRLRADHVVAPKTLVEKHEGNSSFEVPSFVARTLGRGTSAFCFGTMVL